MDVIYNVTTYVNHYSCVQNYEQTIKLYGKVHWSKMVKL